MIPQNPKPSATKLTWRLMQDGPLKMTAIYGDGRSEAREMVQEDTMQFKLVFALLYAGVNEEFMGLPTSRPLRFQDVLLDCYPRDKSMAVLAKPGGAVKLYQRVRNLCNVVNGLIPGSVVQVVTRTYADAPEANFLHSKVYLACRVVDLDRVTEEAQTYHALPTKDVAKPAFDFNRNYDADPNDPEIAYEIMEAWRPLSKMRRGSVG